MASKDLHTIIEESFIFPVKLLNTDTTFLGGIVLDTVNTESVEFIPFTAETAGNGFFEIKPKHGDTNVEAEHVDVPADELIGNAPTVTGVSQIARFGYIGHKRFLSVSIVATGTDIGGKTVGVIVVTDAFRHLPPQ